MRSSPPGRKAPAARVLAAAVLLALPAAVLAAGSSSVLDPWAADRDIFEPMRLEMERSLEGLGGEETGPPYFIAYRLTDVRSLEASAVLGALAGDSAARWGALYVEVRVGDASFDNTDLRYRGWQGRAAWDPAVLRHHLWRLTDGSYKHAVAGFLGKKARRATEFVSDELDDFSLEVSERDSAPSPPLPDIRETLRRLAKRLSAVFRDRPDILDSGVSAGFRPERRYLLTSEGTRIAGESVHIPGFLRAWASTRAPDGMKIFNQRNWTFREPGDLPSERRLEKEVRKLARETEALREASLQPPLSAPAILDPEITGVLFHEAIGHKLEGQRQRDPGQNQLFKERVGKTVLPPFLSLFDDPALESFHGTRLAGYYRFDAEGVRAQRVTLVDHGVLKNFLMSRWPVKGFSASNGHGRADAYLHPTGRMANLVVRAERTVSREELFRRLRELARRSSKDYGFYLVGSFGGENPSTRSSAQTLEVKPRLVYRVDARSGRMTLVRGVKMVGTPLGVLNRITAAADDAEAAVGFHCGAESGSVPVSQIAPSVLISEVEMQRLPEDRYVPPLLPAPGVGKEAQ